MEKVAKCPHFALEFSAGGRFIFRTVQLNL